jgi:hypothetical protein
MGIITDSNEVIPSNLEYSGEETPNAGMFSAFKTCLGQVVRVLYINDKDNRSQKYIEYDVLLSDDNITLSRYRNCRCIDSFGSENNFNEKVLQPVTEAKQGTKKDDTVTYAHKNGALVLVAFIGAHKNSPVILGGLQHPGINLIQASPSVGQIASSSPSIDDRLKELPTLTPGSKAPPAQSQNATSVGATDNDGQRILGEFNGVRWNVNPLGELTIVFQGLKNTKGNLTAPTLQPTIIKINKDGEFFVIDNLDQEIKISRKDEAITITDGKVDPNIITIDRKNDHITVKSVKTVQVVAPEVDLVADTSIITGTTVKLGGKDAKQQAVLGNEFMKLYNDLVSKFNSHTHDVPLVTVGVGAATASSTLSTADTMTSPKHLSQNVKIDKSFSGKPDLS